jgi:SPP1 family phage portal protein
MTFYKEKIMATNKINQIQQQYMQTYGSRQQYLWRYYSGDKSVIPVYKRTAASPLKEKTHTNVHVNYFSDIIDIKQGYMFEKIDIELRDERARDLFDDMKKETSMRIKNSETGELTSVSGLSHRLCYTEDGIFKIKNLQGWQVVYEYENDIYDPDYAYYFYSIKPIDDQEPINYCNVYDRENVYYFVERKEDKKGKIVSQGANTTTSYIPVGEPQPHNFNQVPITPMKNNSLMQSDCEDSVGLMDVYDEVISDTAGELKAARLAYLKIYGDIYTGEDANGEPISLPDYIRDFGTMLFGVDDLGNNLGDAQFLEKKLDDTAIENHLNRMRQHIYEVSGSVDIKEALSAERVLSVKASLMRLENNAKTSENYMRRGLEKMISLWVYFIGETEGVQLSTSDFEITFTRVFPQDTQAQADMLLKLSAVLPLEDALRLAGYEDAREIAERQDDEGDVADMFNQEVTDE